MAFFLIFNNIFQLDDCRVLSVFRDECGFFFNLYFLLSHWLTKFRSTVTLCRRLMALMGSLQACDVYTERR